MTPKCHTMAKSPLGKSNLRKLRKNKLFHIEPLGNSPPTIAMCNAATTTKLPLAIPKTHAFIDSGASSMFIMDGAPITNLTEQAAHLAAAEHANASVANKQFAIFNQTLEDMRVNQYHMEHQIMMIASGYRGGVNNNNNNNQRANRPQRPNIRNNVQRAQQSHYAPQKQTERRAPAQFPAHQQQTMAGMANHF